MNYPPVIKGPAHQAHRIEKRPFPSEAIAQDVGDEAMKLQTKPLGTTVFSYKHRSGATMFGVELRFIDANGAQQSETILTK